MFVINETILFEHLIFSELTSVGSFFISKSKTKKQNKINNHMRGKFYIENN